jgi:hypothetical protein
VCAPWRISRGCPTGTGCPMLRWRRRVAGASCRPAWLHAGSQGLRLVFVPAGSSGARCLTQAAGLQGAAMNAPWRSITPQMNRVSVHAFAAMAAGRQMVGRAPRLLAQLTTMHRHQPGGPSRSSCVPCGCRRPGADKELLNTAAAVAREASDWHPEVRAGAYQGCQT